MYKNKMKDLTKSATVCGKVLEFHPHSDASVYETSLSMVDSSEYTQFPYIHGKGNFSKVYFSDKDSQPASSRYTEMCLSEKADTMFGEMNGVEFQPTEDAHTTEPVLLPTSFPNILTTPTMGIAVGIACNIPSFNFNEVLDATIEYIENGKISKVIAPDFNCGGEYVLNNNALRQIMLEGRGSIKIRGKWHYEGKDIVITELPYYTRINDILTAARTLPGVVNANDETDLQGMRVRITCQNKNIVDTVLLHLLKDTKLQYAAGVNIGVVINNEPKFIGVIEVIDEWVKFRRSVLNKQYTQNLEGVREEMRRPAALIRLISNQELKEKFLDAMKISHIEAEKVLKEAMPDVEQDIIDYILDRKLREFADCEARKKQYQNLLDKEKDIVWALENIDKVIIGQLKALNNKYKIPRKTTIVSNDYSFESIEEAASSIREVKDYGIYVQVKGLYIKKMRTFMGDRSTVISCHNSDVLSLLDNQGRLLRIPLNQVPDCVADGIGSYIPTLFDIDKDMAILDWDIIGKDRVHNYLYKDGYASRLDLSEWAGVSHLTRIIQNGVAPSYIHLIRAKFNEDGYLLVITKNGYCGIMDTHFKAKSRTARTKVINVSKDDEITVLAPITKQEIFLLFGMQALDTVGKMRPIRKDTFNSADVLKSILDKRF